MKCPQIAFYAAAFSILGLVSCTAEKQSTSSPATPPTQVVKVDDTWKLHHPTLKDPRLGSLDFTKADLTHINFASQLEFEPENMKGVDLNISVSCSIPTENTNSPHAEANFTLHEPESIRLFYLIPREFFSSMPIQQLHSVHCSFTFLATNSLQSQHLFKIQDTQFTDFPAENGISFNNTDGRIRPDRFAHDRINVNEIARPDLTPTLDGAPSGVLNLNLICENFTSRVVLTDRGQLSDGLKKILLEPFDPSVSSTTEKSDPRQMHPRQWCHLVISGEGSDGLPVYLYSAEAKFEFLWTPIETSFSLGMRYLNGTNLDKQSIYEMQIHNRGLAPVAIRVSKSPGAQVTLQPVVDLHHTHAYVPLNPFTAVTRIEATGWSQMEDAGDDDIYFVDPARTLSISIKFATRIHCMDSYGDRDMSTISESEAESFSIAAPIGFNFGFAQPIVVKRSIDIKSLTDEGAYVPFDIVPQAVAGADGSLPGWLPHQIEIMKMHSPYKPTETPATPYPITVCQ